MYINRLLEKQIQKYLRTREIVAVIGARQCGKTTLLEHVFKDLKDAIFIDFEDREKLELFENDIEIFIKLYVKDYKFLFIDEFQYAREGGKKLKYIYDKHKTKIIISGSSSSELSIQSVQYLTGRIFIFQLNPLSFEEFLFYKNKKLLTEVFFNETHSKPIIEKFNEYLNEFIVFGGYPRVVTSESEEEKKTVLKNIYNTYFLKEIKQILNLSSDYKLSKLINALALQVGGMLNHNELCSTTGFSYHELVKHLNILNKTFITLESRPYYNNPRTELVKVPKVFFLDSGFRNTVIDNFQKTDIRSDSGSLRENFFASELVKKEIQLKYWRTKSKAEVDFVVQKNGSTFPVEVKSKLVQPKITKSFRSFIEKYKPKQGYIASEGLFANKEVCGTLVKWVPLYHIPKEV